MRKELAEFGLETASKLGASYADIRFLDGEQRLVSVKNGKPDHVSHTSESGYGVRLIVGTGCARVREVRRGASELIFLY
jgi:predicted Zn-dependent protease